MRYILHIISGSLTEFAILTNNILYKSCRIRQIKTHLYKWYRSNCNSLTNQFIGVCWTTLQNNIISWDTSFNNLSMIVSTFTFWGVLQREACSHPMSWIGRYWLSWERWVTTLAYSLLFHMAHAFSQTEYCLSCLAMSDVLLSNTIKLAHLGTFD